MRVAAIYDIHGNLPALDAVLEDIRMDNVDQILVGGDVVPGPLPREALSRLLTLDRPVSFIHGNGEVAVLAVRSGGEPLAVPEPAREAARWTAQQLERKDEETLRTWPLTQRLEIPGIGAVLFCHATPRNEIEVFTRRTPEDRLLKVFEGSGASLVVCGHTHMQFDRIIGGTRVVNAGSVGMPFGRIGAHWLLLGPDVQFRRILYDPERAGDRLRTSDYPNIEGFITRFLFSPPTEEEMLEVFSSVELK
jgi:predicted phosphodiesterase